MAPTTGPPNIADQVIGSEHLPGMDHQRLEQTTFQLRQAFCASVGKYDFPVFGVEIQTLGGQRSRLREVGGLKASHDSLDPRHQLPGAEWLQNVIIRPGLQPADNILLFRAYGEQDNGRIGFASNAFADRKSVFQPRCAGQIDIQEDQVWLILLPATHGAPSVMSNQGLIPGAAEREHDQICDDAIVVNNQAFMLYFDSSKAA